MYWGWFVYLSRAKMKRENFVDYLLARDLFFLKVFRRRTRERVLTDNDVRVEDFLATRHRIGARWLTEGKNSQEELVFHAERSRDVTQIVGDSTTKRHISPIRPGVFPLEQIFLCFCRTRILSSTRCSWEGKGKTLLQPDQDLSMQVWGWETV